MAAQRKPMRRANRQWRQPAFAKPLSVVAARGMADAIAAINGAGESVEGEEALAQMEQRRVDAEAQRRRQGSLPLRGATE